MSHWAERQGEIAQLAEKQLFFIGGIPRSGTTWLQALLDHHPNVSCRGEGHFMEQLAAPLRRAMAARARYIQAKNSLFGHTGGYRLPAAEDTDYLIATAILLELQRQSGGKACLAIGEKTPENVFFYPWLKRAFPQAKFIGLARDPRDMLASAWHMFQARVPLCEEAAAKMAFIKGNIPLIGNAARQMIALAESSPNDCTILTYEALHRATGPAIEGLFRFLGVSDAACYTQDCLRRASFAAMTGGRAAGVEEQGAFLRKAIIGDWPRTLTAEMNEIILRELGWMFAHFGWPE